MKKIRLIALCGIVALTSCSSPANKKVLIIGRGSITATGNDITMKDGSGYAEETVELKGEPVTWNVQTPTGKTTMNIPAEPGFYIYNLKTDTLVGSQQNIGSDLGGRTISQEELKGKIDSLTQLTAGTNVTATSKSYFILPNQLVKISDNMDAKVFGPFTKIPGTLDADKDGKAPELYKFYTNGEMRQLIENFKKMTL